MDFFSVDVDRDLFEDYENAKQMDMRDWEEAVKQEIHE